MHSECERSSISPLLLFTLHKVEIGSERYDDLFYAMRAYVRFGGPFSIVCALCVRGTWIEKEIAWEKPFAFCCCMTLWCDLRHSFDSGSATTFFLRHRLAFEKKAIECVAQNTTIRIYCLCLQSETQKSKLIEPFVIDRSGEKWLDEREKKCVYGDLDYFWRCSMADLRRTPTNWQWNRNSSLHWTCADYFPRSLSLSNSVSAVSSNVSIQRQIDLQIWWIFANHIRE